MQPLTLPITKIRVLCVDDSPDLGAMLSKIIAREPDMESVGVLNSADGLLDEVEKTQVDVVLLDMTMPGRDPVAALSDLAGLVARRRDPALPGAAQTRVIAYSGYTDRPTVELAINAGAWGYVSKDASIETVLRAIRNVAGGATAFEVAL